LYIKDSEKIIRRVSKFKIENSNIINQGDLIKKYALFDINYQLPNQYNMKADKMNMANSIEARTPFLDHRLVEWAFSVPSNMKLKGNNEKFILKLAMKDYLPKSIIKRHKMGFSTPIDLWLKSGMSKITDILLDRLSKRKNLLDTTYIEKLKRNKTKSFFSQKIWLFLFFEVWFETFLERDEIKTPISIF
jgi:asparagine synthase (glutamine-hydrolysing)